MILAKFAVIFVRRPRSLGHLQKVPLTHCYRGSGQILASQKVARPAFEKHIYLILLLILLLLVKWCDLLWVGLMCLLGCLIN